MMTLKLRGTQSTSTRAMRRGTAAMCLSRGLLLAGALLAWAGAPHAADSKDVKLSKLAQPRFSSATASVLLRPTDDVYASVDMSAPVYGGMTEVQVQPCQPMQAPDTNLANQYEVDTVVCGPASGIDGYGSGTPPQWVVSSVEPAEVAHLNGEIVIRGQYLGALRFYLDGQQLYPAVPASSTEVRLRVPDALLSGELGIEVVNAFGEVLQSAVLVDDYRIEFRAFDLFDALDNGSSNLNAFLLAYTSMAMYSEQMNEADFSDELAGRLGPMGLAIVDAFMDPQTGTEGAVMTTRDAVIVDFRGTSSAGTESIQADYLTDANAPMLQMPSSWGTNIHVHKGFYTASDAVHQRILPLVQDAVAEGKQLWLTGHSLGASTATVTAYRLHYVDGVEVQGLQTFGSPRAGDTRFVQRATLQGAGNTSLNARTQRWTMLGDPVPAFFRHGGIDYKCTYQFLVGRVCMPAGLLTYQHLGTTNTINSTNTAICAFTGFGTCDYDFVYDDSEPFENGLPGLNPLQIATGLALEHMMYVAALHQELGRHMQSDTEQQFFSLLPQPD